MDTSDLADLAPTRHEPHDFTFPGARRPDRRRMVHANGVRLAVWEWGAETAPPVLFAHGGFDFAGTYDTLAPIVADAGFRVISWDQRGHGDSSRGHLYSWHADLTDAVAVLDSLDEPAIPVVGHSKGGALMLQLAAALPHRVTRLVNIDGLPSRRSWPDVPDHQRTAMLKGEVEAWLDHRRAASTKIRRPGTIAELAERRQKMNTRLGLDWLGYIAHIGAFQRDDGWRWKIDPAMRMGGFGPWNPEWSMSLLPALGMPVLCLLGLEPEEMGWGTSVEDIEPNLPPDGRLLAFDDLGHFLHIEDPRRIADLILEHLS